MYFSFIPYENTSLYSTLYFSVHTWGIFIPHADILFSMHGITTRDRSPFFHKFKLRKQKKWNLVVGEVKNQRWNLRKLYT
jgi:hypothetical protein